jgi:triphosphoribosyl-dephospho-CoA synthetase
MEPAHRSQSDLDFESNEAQIRAGRLADLAVRTLIAETELTSKPALVDARGSGVHADLSPALMLLHGSGWVALRTAQRGAAAVLAIGGASTVRGRALLQQSDHNLIRPERLAGSLSPIR